jgi:hypothetical protein
VTLFLICVGAREDEKMLPPFKIPRISLVHLLKIRVWIKEKKHKIFLLSPKHYGMKTCGTMKVHFQAFLTSVLDEHKW